ncbi:hypothetical protein M409DRAFT_15834 [Zasmidium cellare ATCC 36951]|uniref:Uncharacterized protein n=1 Tax=Zasmidium cellare ATCC 36951 TaxID=1080233 RepID=A0A6A6D2A4_ZASCE|nr:uncharacterized protein M409DRAFT_15834 [Zasmidium cellare ATCC 36951]KAF2173554.1 hypothetical protein M409DRAFT_15834 [Zasmidium cellare ATCC 36951]
MTSPTAHEIGPEQAWDELMARGKQHAQEAQWELALQVYTTAMSLCSDPTLQSDTARRHRVLKDLAYTNRCMGRYEQSLTILDELVPQLSTSDPLRLNVTGELGVLYRQLNRLEEARDAFYEQYKLATQLNELQRMCRAVGNLGMANYQLAQRDHDTGLLDLAAKQLQERVRLAQDLRDASAADPTKASKHDYYTILKAVGLSRLSICYSARGDNHRAVATALEAVQLETEGRPFSDSSVEAISRFFYGRALYRAGRQREALEQFDLPKKCSPAVAFCKEPSVEHCEYLQELLDAGAQMDTPDEHGYHALDYAVFNGNKTAQRIILKSLERNVSQNSTAEDVSERLDKRLEEARLRKHYREIFQDQMRPVLLSRKDDSLHRIRQTYASAIDSNIDFSKSFDRLKFVKYADFLTFNHFPRSNDGLTQKFNPKATNAASQHIVFISYRWVNRNPWARYPDNAENKQYHRILLAISEYLTLHPSLHPSNLGIWIDFACIDQDAPMPGISALPLIIAQCDALISLVDEQYHQRAWCSVEVMMVQALRERYGVHVWYEHVLEGGLRRGSRELKPEPGGKELGVERDRERVVFLERQCRLLC